jgi:hypothetical protein
MFCKQYGIPKMFKSVVPLQAWIEEEFKSKKWMNFETLNLKAEKTP